MDTVRDEFERRGGLSLRTSLVVVRWIRDAFSMLPWLRALRFICSSDVASQGVRHSVLVFG